MAAEFESSEKSALLAFDSLLDADADPEAEIESDDDDVQIIEPDEDDETEDQHENKVMDVSPSLPDLLGDDQASTGAETRTPDLDQGPDADASGSADVEAEAADDDIDDASTEPAVTDNIVDLTTDLTDAESFPAEMADKSQENDGDKETVGSDMEEGEEQEDEKEKETEDVRAGSEAEEEQGDKDTENNMEVVSEVEENGEDEDDDDNFDDKENVKYMQIVEEIEDDEQEVLETKEESARADDIEKEEGDGEKGEGDGEKGEEDGEKGEEDGDKDEGDGDKGEGDGEKGEEDGEKGEGDGDKEGGDKKEDKDEKENGIEDCSQKVSEAEDEKEEDVVGDADTTADETTAKAPVAAEDASDAGSATVESPSKELVPEVQEAAATEESAATEVENKEKHDDKEEPQDESLTKKERAKRKKGSSRVSTDDEEVGKTSVKCTSCGSRLHSTRSTICAHPILKVAICKMCLGYYNSGSFSRDSDGMDEQCRWCAEGGKLVCCDVCTNAFCQSCIRREFGGKELSRILKAVEWRCFVCDPSPLAEKVALCERVITVKKEKPNKEARTDCEESEHELAESTKKGGKTRKNSEESKPETAESTKKDGKTRKDSEESKPDQPAKKNGKTRKECEESKPVEPVKNRDAGKDCEEEESKPAETAKKEGLMESVKKWTDSILAASTKVTGWAVDFRRRLADFEGPECDLLPDVSCIAEVVHDLNSDVNLLLESLGKKNNVKVKLLKGEKGKRRSSGDCEPSTDVDPSAVVDGEDSMDNKAEGDGASVVSTKGSKCKVGVKEEVKDDLEENEEDVEEEKEEENVDDAEPVVTKVKEGSSKGKGCMRPPDSNSEEDTLKSAKGTSSEEGSGTKRKSQKQTDKSSTPNKVTNDNDLAKRALLKALDESEDSGHSSSGRRPMKSTDDDDTDTSLLRKMSPRKTKKTPERTKKKATFTPSSESDRDEVGIGRLRSRVTSPVVPFSLQDTAGDPKLAAQVRVVLKKLPLGSEETSVVSERGVSSKKRRLALSNSDSDFLGKCVAKLANLSNLKGGRSKKKRCLGDSDDDSPKDSGQEKKKDGKKKKAATDESEASDRPADDGGGSGSEDMDADDAKAPLRNLTGKSMCENDYAKATLVNDLQDNSSHGDSTTDSDVTKNGKRVKKAKQEQQAEEDAEKSAAEEEKGSGEEDGDRRRKKSKAVDKLLRIPLEEKALKDSDSDGASPKEFK